MPVDSLPEPSANLWLLILLGPLALGTLGPLLFFTFRRGATLAMEKGKAWGWIICGALLGGLAGLIGGVITAFHYEDLAAPVVAAHYDVETTDENGVFARTTPEGKLELLYSKEVDGKILLVNYDWVLYAPMAKHPGPETLEEEK